MESVRYANRDRPRPKRQHYSEFESEYSDIDIPTYLDILGFGDKQETLRFQLEAWRQIRNAHESARRTGTDQGVVLSAPTGFGKTGGIMGEMLHKIAAEDTEVDSAVCVYPSRALLRDQLSTMLERAVNLSQLEGYQQPGIGIWSSDVPFTRRAVADSGKDHLKSSSSTTPSGSQLRILSHWDESKNDTGLYVDQIDSTEYLAGYEEGSKDYITRTADGEFEFDSRQLTLHRQGVRLLTEDERPQVIFTTLESFENIGLKPHYDILAQTDFFVFDEIHQYTGVRGSHASHIIQNIQWMREQHDEGSGAATFIGASATVADPPQFASDLFGFNTSGTDSEMRYVRNREIDIDQDNNDKQHFYFMITPGGENSPGVASQYIQQALLSGHSLLKEDDSVSKSLTFIDSTSQVERLSQQIKDAKQKLLYRKHINLDETDAAGDWKNIADVANRNFRKDFNGPVAIHADSDDNLNDLIGNEIINSTSFLEVGMDIDDLEFIGQYRPPSDLATFKQRAGRGGRSKKDDTHVQVFLSRYAGDQNFFYRADRFLSGDVHTPLNPHNEVIRWVHDRYREIYTGIHELYDDIGGGWYNNRHESRFIQKVFCDEIGYERYHRFLTEPDNELNDLLDISPVAPKLFKNNGSLSTVESALNRKKAEIRADLREKRALIGGGNEATIPNTRIQRVRELAEKVRSQIDIVRKGSFEGSENFEEIYLNLSNITEEDIDDAIQTVNEGIDALGPILFKASEEQKEELITVSEVGNIQESLDVLKEGDLAQELKQRDIIDQLLQSLEGIKSYLTVRDMGTAHGSLSAYKGLLQSAYFFNRACQIHENEYEKPVRISEEHRDNPDAEIWYVPDDYFDNAGRYFSLSQVRDTGSQNQSQESIDVLFGKYLPFKAEYLESGSAQAYLPEVRQRDGSAEIQFSEESTYVQQDIHIPNTIELEELTDFSGDEADEIFPLHPDTFHPITNEQMADFADVKYGKAYAQPIVSTQMEFISSQRSYEQGSLSAGLVEGEALLKGVELEVSLYQRRDGEFVRASDDDPPIQRLGTDSDFGFILQTSGIRWDVSEFLTDIFESERGTKILEFVRRHKPFDDIDEERAAKATAAHFLTLLIADVTGSDPRGLMYGIGSNNEVHVFDKSQGGQGIIELFNDEMRENPTAVVNSIYRLAHNSQILSDRLWASDESADDTGRAPWEIFQEDISITALQDAKHREDVMDQIKQVSSQILDITFDPSLNRIAEEVASGIERIHYLAEDNPFESELYLIKHDMAQARQEGEPESYVTESVQSDFEEVFEHENIVAETVRDLLYPPDVDSGKANLHLEESILEVDQSNAISNTFAENLVEHIISDIPVGERHKLREDGRYWARLDDDQVEYLSWGDEL
ncbi:DEAD/DEAH box helicase [Halorubrum cibi]|uniref:DEAD/DEAH box helicase n=1 Tax=Halorubrum cibi TaxID=413815 RepID=UPI0024822604|nr:DEAD/DEAH box helicase [Halorubrum cibi]